jgi:excinuclease ABC subunit A
MVIYYKAMLKAIASHYGQNMEKPCKDLPDDFKKTLLHGSGETEITFQFWRAGKASTVKRPFEGVLPNMERLYAESESEFTRNRLKAFMSPQFCDACAGKRLRPEILAVTFAQQGRAERPANGEHT